MVFPAPTIPFDPEITMQPRSLPAPNTRSTISDVSTGKAPRLNMPRTVPSPRASRDDFLSACSMVLSSRDLEDCGDANITRSTSHHQHVTAAKFDRFFECFDDNSRHRRTLRVAPDQRTSCAVHL